MSLQSRLASFITAVGADIKQIKSDISSHTHPETGADPWTHQALATGYTNSTVTASDVFAGFTPLANTRYIVDALLSVQAAAATTGVQTGLMGPTTGIPRSAVKIVSAINATSDKIDHLSINGFQVATAGLQTPYLVSIQAIVEVGATPGAGKIRIQARSEVANSLIIIHPGSSMRWRTI